MDTVIAVIDQDQEYLKNLIDYMKSKKGYMLTIVAFSDVDAYLDFESANLVSILLCQERYFSKIVEKSIARQKICFKESKVLNKDDKSGIFKYQSAGQIMMEILELVDENKEIVLVNKGNMQAVIVSMCALGQELSSSIISLALAHECSKKKRTLFLSFDPFLSNEIFTKQDSTEGISDMIYYVKQGNKNLNIRIQSLISKKESLDYIFGVAHWSDISELAEGDLEQIIHVVKEQLGYDLIIVDVGSITNVTTLLFKHSNFIYEIASKGSYAKCREKEFRRQLLLKAGADIIERLIPIIVPKDVINEENFSANSDKLSVLGKDLISRNYFKDIMKEEGIW